MWQDHYDDVSKDVFSENCLYSVTIHLPAPHTWEGMRDSSQSLDDSSRSPELIVSRHDAESKKLFWSKAVPLGSELPDDIPFHGFRSRSLVTNDGRTVVVWIQIFPNRPTLYIFSKDSAAALDSWDLLAILPPRSDEQFDFDWFIAHDSLELLGRVNARDLYALWIRPMNRWVVIPLDEPAFRIPSPAETEELHRQMLRRCRQTVERYEAREGCKEKSREPIDFLDVSNAYHFIALNGDPTDRPAAERLLTKPLLGGFHPCPPLGFPGVRPFLSFASSERALGVELLTNWAKPKAEEPNAGAPQETFFGAIAGVIRFPFPLPNPPGRLLLKVTPVLEEREAKGLSPICIEFQLPEDRPSPWSRRKSPRPNELSFQVGTLSAGEYRLQAVWERHSRMQEPHWVEREATPNSKGGAYESRESEKLPVHRGEVIEGIRLECIHRTSADPSLYANDLVHPRHSYGPLQ